MTQLSLPPVAKSFYTFCKKCDADRYHTVLTHTSATSAKIECEVCKSRKSYSLPKAASSTSKKTTSTSGTAAKSRSSSAVSARSHAGQYALLTQNKSEAESITYSMKTKFSEHQKVSHPKFGIGFIIKTYNDKIEVIFSDEVRTLMHNRA